MALDNKSSIICLITDFGTKDPYVGQLKGAISRLFNDITIIDLFHGVPRFNVKACAYLLPHLLETFPLGTVFVCIVDPGVGSSRPSYVVELDGRWLIGPGNGLFEIVTRRSSNIPNWWKIIWEPKELSASFHGRDLFAPIAAFLAKGCNPADEGRCVRIDNTKICMPNWPDDLAEVVYIDQFSNAIIGYRWKYITEIAKVSVGSHCLKKVRTFSDVPLGEPFCYNNSMGLLEVAINQGYAAQFFDLSVGSPILIKE